MKKDKRLFNLCGMVVLAIVVISLVAVYLINTLIQETSAVVDFTKTELGSNYPVRSRISDNKQLAMKIAESGAQGFMDEYKVNQFSQQIRDGLTDEKLAYVKSRYLETFLDADQAYKQLGAKSQAWENLRAEVAETTKANQKEWKAQLDDLDARTMEALRQSLASEIGDKIAKLISAGDHSPKHVADQVRETMGQLTKKARENIDAAVLLLEQPRDPA